MYKPYIRTFIWCLYVLLGFPFLTVHFSLALTPILGDRCKSGINLVTISHNTCGTPAAFYT